LRQRLDQYFAAEKQDEPFRLAFPRGSYAPLFTEKKALQTPELQQPDCIPEEISPDRGQPVPSLSEPAVVFSTLKTIPWVLVVLLSVAIGITRLRGTRIQMTATSKAKDLVLQRFWTGIFTPGSATLDVEVAGRLFDVPERMKGGSGLVGNEQEV